MANADVVIIGAGLVGSSIARSLSLAGLRTVNVDRLPAAGYGSTSHSSAIVRPFYSHTTSCAIAHASRCRWLQWGEMLQLEPATPLAEYEETGGLVLLKTGHEHQFDSNLAAMREVGVAYEIIDATDLSKRLPGMSLQAFGPPKTLSDPSFGSATEGEIGGAIYIPACGHVSDPQLAAANLASAAVNRMAGIPALPIQTSAQRHEVAYVRAPQAHNQGFSLAHRGFLVDPDSGFYARRDGADYLIGSIDPDCDPVHVVDPDDYLDTFTEQWTLQVYRAAQRMPQLEIESRARGTVGLYDVSDDWIPIYDKTDLPGYYLAIGTSGNQFKNAPLIGDIMCAIIMAGQNGVDHDVSPQHLTLAEVERTVNLSFFSRLREVQATASVLA